MTAPTHILPMPTIGQSPRRMVLFKHRVVIHSELPSVLGSTFGELYQRIESSGVAPAGPPFVIYLDDSEPGVRWSIDICAPVSAPISAAPEFEFCDMPAGRVVSVMHFGPYDELGIVYDAIDRFIKEKDLTVAGPPREFYFSEPDVPPEKVQTLVEWPVI
jgi:effector-binding domain-containing protein